MTAQRNRRLAAGIAAAATLTLGLAVTNPSAATAATLQAPEVTVTPSTNLADGQVVTVSVNGFGANETLYIGQCTDIDATTFVCDEPGLPSVSVTTDATGSGTTTVTVHRTFDGYLVGSGSTWGSVDCSQLACYLGVGNATQGGGSPVLSFS
ncbi:enediyne antibiotic chromoprotein [Micromonospora sediminicola]|uniref:enediyne antibiotic chromoprotein n=1 Tax=Micromonospora sediminicola TaxID=946078 RepID=UPI00340B2F49